ncbi:MAG: MotA/TolQ/ExbB proton channel family protein [Sandaracinaceae bacterium]
MFVYLQATTEDYNFWNLVMAAPLVVKALILVLVVMMLVSWFIVGAKLVRMFQATSETRRFLQLFWAEEESGTWAPERIETVYAQIKSLNHSPLAKVFHAGYVELARLTSGSADREGVLDNVERSLRRSSTTEMTKLESLLPFLATTGSTAPFIGLLGTVLGILEVFHQLGGTGDASLGAVGPKIAEALFVTAIGLFAAIPAVMAYNYFVRRVRVIEAEVETFGSDFLNIVKRHFL